MNAILEGIFKGLVQWLFSLFLEIVEYISNSLLGVFNMDLSYFEQNIPVTNDIFKIIVAVGWALLLGNLVFQAARSMVAGLGFDGEDPKLLFTRTFVFSFLLLVSREICNIGLGITSTVIGMLQVPSAVQIPVPEETTFSIGASWLLVVIIGFVVMWQVIKLFFEIGERYVVTAVLTILSPLAFAMGGSKSTEDIFKGWVRMYGSMCLMMVFNVIFLKLLISALGVMPTGLDVLPWMVLIMGIAKVARKIDSIITRIGLNPAITGDGLGRSLPGVLAFTVAKSLGSTVAKSIGKGGGHAAAGASGRTPPGGTGGGGTSSGGGRTGGGASQTGRQSAGGWGARTGGASSAQSPHTATGHPASAAAGTAAAGAAAQAASHGGKTPPTSDATAEQAQAGTQAGRHTPPAPGTSGETGSRSGPDTQGKRDGTSNTRRTAVPFGMGAVGRSGSAASTPGGGFAGRPAAAPGQSAPGTAGRERAEGPGDRKTQVPGTGSSGQVPHRPPLSRAQKDATAPPTSAGTAGTPGTQRQETPETTRFSAVPPQARQEARPGAPGAPGHPGASGGVARQSSATAQTTRSETVRSGAPSTPAAAQGPGQAARPPIPRGTAGSAATKDDRPSQSGKVLTTSEQTTRTGGVFPTTGTSRNTQVPPTGTPQVSAVPPSGLATPPPPSAPAAPGAHQARQERPPLSGTGSTRRASAQASGTAAAARTAPPTVASGTAHMSPPSQGMAGTARQAPLSSPGGMPQTASTTPGTAGTARTAPPTSRSHTAKPPVTPSVGQGTSRIAGKDAIPGGKLNHVPQSKPKRQPRGGAKRGE